MKKKFFLSLTAVLMAMMMLITGCGSQATTSDEKQATTTAAAESAAEATQAKVVNATIEFLHSDSEEPRVKGIQGIIDAFMSANPGITLKQLPIPEDGYWTKITTLMSSGKLPAIIDGAIDQMRLMNEEGVVDTKANTEVIDLKGKDAFFKGALDIMKAPDKDEYLGVPVSGWVAGIWYRKDLFVEKGLPAPTTWENILNAAKTFNDPAKKKYGIAFATEESDFTEQTFTQFALSNNAVLFDSEGKPMFNSAEMKEAIQFYKDLYQYGPKGSNGVTQVKDAFVGGNAAMAVYSTYIMPSLYEQKMADKIGFAVPEKKVAAGFGMTSSLTITNSIKPEERAAAIMFISYMLGKDTNITRLHMSAGGANPVLKEVAADPKYTSHELLKAFGDTASKVPEAFNELKMFGFENGKTHPKMGNITGKLIIPKTLNAILVQNADIDKEIEKAQITLEKIVNEK
jgi:multiple sugar transport system substrate-binding protein